MARIAVVDRDREVLGFFQGVLGRRGHVVHLADPDSAPALIRWLQPDLAVIAAPFSDDEGWDLLRGLRQDPLTEQIAVLLCTGAVGQSVHPQALVRDPRTGFAPMPWESRELLEKVESALVAMEPPAASGAFGHSLDARYWLSDTVLRDFVERHVSSVADLVLLALLTERRHEGLVPAETARALKITPAVARARLHALAEQGLLQAPHGGERRVFRISEQGETPLLVADLAAALQLSSYRFALGCYALLLEKRVPD